MKPINGFTRKPHPNQILAYFGLSALAAVYFLIIFPLSSNFCKGVGGILELILWSTVLVSGYIASKTDPTDSIVKDMHKAKREGKEYIPPIQQFYCSSDSSYTTEYSKHCYLCNRCTEGYDHHCSWLNNDIGKANYKAFFVFISAVLAFFAVYLPLAIKLAIDFSVDSTLLQNDIWMYGDKVGYIKFAIVLLWISIPPSIGILIFVLCLVFLHLFLTKKGITTFQYMAFVEQNQLYPREIEVARKALGGNERTFFDFVLFLGRNIRNNISKISTSSHTTMNQEFQNFTYQDNEQSERLVFGQQRKEKYNENDDKYKKKFMGKAHNNL